MVSKLRPLGLLLLLAATLCAQAPLDQARRAQALLGPEVWSRVITVRNQARAGPYPGVVHALVFELGGILWFYTDTNGTQSFSLYPGRLEQDKADFTPLLRDIEPGFGRWSVLKPAPARGMAEAGPLRNGCFIESLAALRGRLQRGLPADHARLLSYYSDTPHGQNGHTVLVYEAEGKLEVFDPGRPAQSFAIPPAAATGPLALARTLDGRDVTKAMYLPLTVDPLSGGVLATIDAAQVRLPAGASRLTG